MYEDHYPVIGGNRNGRLEGLIGHKGTQVEVIRSIAYQIITAWCTLVALGISRAS